MSEDSNAADEGQSHALPGTPGEELSVSQVLYSRGGGKAAPSRPMFLCLHGWGSNEEDLAGIMRYVAPYSDYASLRAPLVLQEAGAGEFGMGSGAYSWFHDALPVGDDLDRDAFAAASAINAWVEANIARERELVPIGFSQGGLLAVHLLRLNPERYRAAICLSGFMAAGNVEGSAPADERLAALEIPVFYGYGKQDSVVPKYEIFAMLAWLEEHSWLTVKEYAHLDHAVSMEEFADIRQWLLLNNITSGVL
ncbi:esterase [Bifidobacterium aemilianum]|uniref:Esterase n=1 Tax=Bifidobacterium aemilianum TaxID=2493120 RepID=A0A366K9E2_9BIFI|nr:alpha/beta hydrolase-fold protein [Bifidobacterium aemilianum]RBP97271.1 esterase [Bifidobacterium aemilianum]